VNTSAPKPMPREAWERVLGIQAKLHRWATDDPDRRFDDLFNLVCDPAFLLMAWTRVRRNKGSRSAGIDGQTARYIEAGRGVEAFLEDLWADLKAQGFEPLAVRERMIPKPGSTKKRRLGIPTVRDRVVQGALKLVLEPILEADFSPSSYGFRPNRRADDAIAEIRHMAARSYEWVLEGDIKACFDEIDHAALMGRLRDRVKDKRVLALVKAFLKAGILSEEGTSRDTSTGTPQGGLLSPLLANLALSGLDEHFDEIRGGPVDRTRRRRHGLPNYRIVRYADDFVVMVSGTRAHAEELIDEVAAVLAPMGLTLSAEKTKIAHIDEGFDFLGWRIQRHRKRGMAKSYVYTYPSKKALRAVMDKVRRLTGQATNCPLPVLLHRINPVLRGWATYFRPGVSGRTFKYLNSFAWSRVFGWLRRKHRQSSVEELRRRYCEGRWWPHMDGVWLFKPTTLGTTRYRYRGAAIPTPWASVAT
jgi:RNA-directed DNA polymerase